MRKAGLDDVDAQFLQGMRHAHLGATVHREAGGLLAIAQGGVEDAHAPAYVAVDGIGAALVCWIHVWLRS
ncbi:hypothetical protein QFZ41_002236 [Luteibacter sp. W1I16]